MVRRVAFRDARNERRRGLCCAIALGIPIAALLSIVGAAQAGEDPVLVLPLSKVLALIDRPASGVPATRGVPSSSWRGAATGTPPPPAFIPRRIHIPDLYKVDCERDAPRFAEPVDNDRMVALELLAPAHLRPSMSFRFDKESLPLGASSSRLSIEFELPF